MVTFSAYEADGRTIVQILGLARAGDPVYEGAFRAVGSGLQVRIWTHVLWSLAAYLGIPALITTGSTCVDRGVYWSRFGNLWYNAQVRTTLREPLWVLNTLLRRRSGKG
jgi:hypothetical protein